VPVFLTISFQFEAHRASKKSFLSAWGNNLDEEISFITESMSES
jgi:hypothetical protein